MAEAGGSARPSARTATPLVLVADGEAETREAVTSLLRRFAGPVEIAQTGTGRDALAVLLTRQPALAFINLQLRELTGAEALAFARARGVRTLAFLMSGQVLPRWIEISTELNAYDFLRTPFDTEHVVALLSNWRRMAEPSRLLLVDEGAASRQHTRQVLANTRFPLAVDEAASADQALDLLRSGGHGLALIACAPHGADWISTVSRIRALSPRTKLFLMAAGDGAALGEVARLGGATVLRKPFFAPEFDHRFHSVLGLRRPYLLNALGGSGPAAAAARLS